jgi:prepilin-type N-terminal cleavage/methylation domain-containing protein
VNKSQKINRRLIMLNKKSNRGFTLIEMVVVLAVIGILAAILTPTIAKNINDSKIARASNEVQVIAAAVASFYKDLGRWPTSNGTAGNPDYLYMLFGPGDVYTNAGAGTANWLSTAAWGTATARGDLFLNHLVQNAPEGVPNSYATTGPVKWDGPYLTEIKADPWGSHYACNIRYTWNLTTNAAAVFSAGPDRVAQINITQPLATFTLGTSDDIVQRLR